MITPTLNDGIVNSVRQIVRPNPDEFGGFIVADHADVLGHYDHQDALVGGKPFDAGLFHSGAGFGDTQFFELYRTVAEIILHARTKARVQLRRQKALLRRHNLLKRVALKNATPNGGKTGRGKTAPKKGHRQTQHIVDAAERFRRRGRSGRKP
jgi:hypothetical protein